MIWRLTVGICSIAMIAAATHLNVVHTGGYASDGAPLVIATAALLTVGMGFVGLLWSDGRRAAAIGLTMCMLAGEVYWFCANAEREITQREQQALPRTVALNHRAAAEKRLQLAEAAKAAADAAAVSEAAKPGCKVNCAQLLSTAQLAANTELAAARSSEAGLPLLPAAHSLPDRLGVAPWAWDLWIAALRALSVMGASIAAGLALHSRLGPAPAAPTLRLRATLPAHTPMSIEDQRQPKRAAKAKKIDPRDHVSEFLIDWVKPDPAGTASLRELHERHFDWCKLKSKQPLPPSTLGRELRLVIDEIGLTCEPAGNDATIRGAVIKN